MSPSLTRQTAPIPGETRLQADLAELAEGGDPARPGPIDALRLARRRFEAAERIDMSALAGELGVNRVTLYRWVGSREQLLVEVIWDLGETAFEQIDRQVRAAGAERVVRVVTRFIDGVLGHAGMRHWIADEGQSAIRLLTIGGNAFQQRLIGRIERVLAEEADAGRIELPAAPREVAFVVVRLMESDIYLDLIAADEGTDRRAEPVLRMLLR